MHYTKRTLHETTDTLFQNNEDSTNFDEKASVKLLGGIHRLIYEIHFQKLIH